MNWRTGSADQFRVVAYRPGVRFLFMLGVGLTVLVAAIGGFWLGRQVKDFDARYAEALESKNQSNAQQIQALRATLADLQFRSGVRDEASESLQQSIKELRDELAATKEEVSFYKSLMAPSDMTRGLQIDKFELVRRGEPGGYAFTLLLTQVESRRSFISGVVRVDVVGDGPQGQQVLSLTEIATLEAYPLNFRFRYFQDFSGQLQLPEGFEPRSVVVTAVRSGVKDGARQKTFEWQPTEA